MSNRKRKHQLYSRYVIIYICDRKHCCLSIYRLKYNNRMFKTSDFFNWIK